MSSSTVMFDISSYTAGENYQTYRTNSQVASKDILKVLLKRSIAEAEHGFLELYGKLAGYYQIIIRSLSLNPVMMAFLLGMNIVFRKEYPEMKSRHNL